MRWLLLQSPPSPDGGMTGRDRALPGDAVLAAPPAGRSLLHLGDPATAAPGWQRSRHSLPEGPSGAGAGRGALRNHVCPPRSAARPPPFPGSPAARPERLGGGLSPLARRSARPRGAQGARPTWARPYPGGSGSRGTGTRKWKSGRSPTLSRTMRPRPPCRRRSRHVLALRSPQRSSASLSTATGR